MRDNDIKAGIVEILEDCDLPPTIRELQTRLDVSSTSVIYYHIQQLAQAGIVTYKPKKARTLRLTRKHTEPRQKRDSGHSVASDGRI